MSPEELATRARGAGRPKKEFEPATIRRMFDAREETTDKEIARSHNITVKKLVQLIGRRNAP